MWPRYFIASMSALLIAVAGLSAVFVFNISWCINWFYFIYIDLTILVAAQFFNLNYYDIPHRKAQRRYQ